MTRRTGYKARVIDTRQPRQRFLIVCEGAKTEPNYFKSFRVPMDVRVRVIGLGEDPLTLVRSAADFNEQDSYDQVWCVFDRDSWPQDKFDNAINSARSKGFEIAYSNEAFELWYVLHFEFLNTGIPRAAYIAKMSEHLGKPYLKNSEDIYEVLLPLQPTAIRNAERLLDIYDPHYPGRDNPSTGVHKLVMELNQFLPS
jgi:hypothetical protein